MVAAFGLKTVGREHVRQKLYWGKGTNLFLGEVGGGGGGGMGDLKIRISLFSRFQKPEFRHESEKFYPCVVSMHSSSYQAG